MQEETCVHLWEMINVRYGFIITEKCYHCNIHSTYFSFEDRPPLEEYRTGDHFWNVMGSVQSVRFDLKCEKCDVIIPLDELCGLMLCTGCDEKCFVYKIMKEYEKERTWIYIAFGYLPVNEKKQLNLEKITAIEEYFNLRRKSSKSKIKIISGEKVENFASCYAEAIKDVDMLSLTSPETDNP